MLPDCVSQVCGGHTEALTMSRKVSTRSRRPLWGLLLWALVFSLMLSQAVFAESQDYYELLRVARDASVREIRQAFKKLALIMHPDKNPVSSFNKKKKKKSDCTKHLWTKPDSS